MGKKGKKAAGRAGAKQKAKGRNSTTPRTTPRSRGYNNDDWDDDEPVRFKGFAQKNGSLNPQGGNPFAKLRHQAISFVSAGTNSPPEQTKHQSPQHEAAGDDLHFDDDITLDDADDGEEDSDIDDVDDSNIETNIMIEDEVEISQKGMERMHIHTSSAKAMGAAAAMDMEEAIDAAEAMDLNTDTADTNLDAGPLPFVVDTVGDAALADAATFGGKRPLQRAPSPAPSNSSEEVVLYRGRSKATVVDDPVQPASAPTPAPAEQTPSQGWGAHASKYDTLQQPGDRWAAAPTTPFWKKGKGKAVSRPELALSDEERSDFQASLPKQSKVQFAQAGENEGDAEQTISALQADWKKTLQEKKKNKEVSFGEDSKPAASCSARRKKRGRKKDKRAERKSTMSDDQISEAAYEDYMENLKAQLDGDDSDESASQLIALLQATTSPMADSGPSMVVGGKEIGDDEVLPDHKKEERQDMGDIRLNDDSDWESDDEELNPDYDELSLGESVGSLDLESDLEYTENQQWEDEQDLRKRRIERMSDEKIARLLAKQEELGMDATELLIEDGEYQDEFEEEFGDLSSARAGLSELSNFSLGRRANKRGMRRSRANRDTFPDASLMADTVDQYGQDGFDILDFDRPSLRPTKKGRRGKLPAELEELSDEELKADMAAAWEKDRSKKRQKKLEREELRAEGLLGSAGRKGKADLSNKYPFGMNLQQVWRELAEFLQDEDMRERSFPPMDKVDRKSLHEVAVALDLKSKSQGNGLKRFPIIYKTSNTKMYSADMFNRVLRASGRGFLTNRGAAKKMARRGAGDGPGKKGKGGGGMDAATVRHGEVVGTGAAELGKENFGHKLMEKMGWSKGMGLGKSGEGSLTPVEQIMRRGTAGLG